MADAARCDQCSTHADRPTFVRGFNPEPGSDSLLPEGWLRVGVRSAPMAPAAVAFDQEDGEFCTWDCAAKWLAAVADQRAVSA